MKNTIRVIWFMFSICCFQTHAETTTILDCGKYKGFESEAIFYPEELRVNLNFKNKLPQEKTQIRLIKKCLYKASEKYNLSENIYGVVTLDGEMEPSMTSKYTAPTVSYNYIIYFDNKTKTVKKELNPYGP